MTHIALEGRVFVLTACQAIRLGEYPDWYQEEIGEDPAEYLMRGGSAIIAPDGSVLAGPLFDEEGILDTEIDLAQITRGHLDMDAVGHYSRPDVFELRVTRAGNRLSCSPTAARSQRGGRARGRRGAVTRTAVAIRHVHFADLGLLAPLHTDHDAISPREPPGCPRRERVDRVLARTRRARASARARRDSNSRPSVP